MFLPELQFASPESQKERIILVLFGGLLAGFAKAAAFQNRGSKMLAAEPHQNF